MLAVGEPLRLHDEVDVGAAPALRDELAHRAHPLRVHLGRHAEHVLDDDLERTSGSDELLQHGIEDGFECCHEGADYGSPSPCRQPSAPDRPARAGRAPFGSGTRVATGFGIAVVAVAGRGP